MRWETAGSVAVPVERGAEFIHGAAAEDVGVAGRSRVDGGRDRRCDVGRDARGELQRSDDDDISDVDLFERVAELAADESVETFLRRFDDDPHTHADAQRARVFVEGFEAADPALASVRSIAEELHSGVDSSSARPVGSYAPLFAHLVRTCTRAGADLRLNTAVERVVCGAGAVTITARGATGDREMIRARCAIVTVPVGVLQQRAPATPLTFEPPLPAAKQMALQRLEMGHAVRVALAFRTPFWERIADGRYRDAAFFRCEGAFNVFWTQLPLRDRTIVAWAGGPRATALRDLTAQERIERAREQFGALLGERDLVRSEFEAGATHDWSADPFACGAYSYVTTGGGDARAELGAPAGDTLFFAGEATQTDGQGGTVSGAFASGLRAADAIIRVLESAAAPAPNIA